MAKTHWQPVFIPCDKCLKEITIHTVALNIEQGDFLFEGICGACGEPVAIVKSVWELMKDALETKVLMHMWGSK